MTRIPALFLSLLLCCALGACGEDGDTSLFSETDAREAADRFCRPLVRGDLHEALTSAGIPFRFRTRTWMDMAEVKSGLEPQMPWLRAQLEDAQDMEVFSYQRLSRGEGPRGKVEDLGLYGIQHDGYLVWIKKLGNQTALLLVLNPDPDRTRLVATAMDPS